MDAKLIVLFLFTILIGCSTTRDDSNVNNKRRDSLDIQTAKAPVYLGEPLSIEGTKLLNDVDGSIKKLFKFYPSINLVLPEHLNSSKLITKTKFKQLLSLFTERETGILVV